MTTNKRGIELLQDPSLNKSTAFTEAEKQALGIVGLVPDVTETLDLQLSRVMMQLGHKNTDLDRYIYLINLLDHNETLFYRTVMSDPARFCRSFTTRPSGKPASSSAIFTARRAACIYRSRGAAK
jgi:malate dehydrogenase (oxaloacetate-decarboxylating)(NADP+)